MLKTQTKTDNDAAAEKEETVYVVADPDGTPNEVIVSDWLKNYLGADTIEDVSELTDIEKCKRVMKKFYAECRRNTDLAGRWQ